MGSLALTDSKGKRRKGPRLAPSLTSARLRGDADRSGKSPSTLPFISLVFLFFFFIHGNPPSNMINARLPLLLGFALIHIWPWSNFYQRIASPNLLVPPTSVIPISTTAPRRVLLMMFLVQVPTTH